MTSYLLLLTIFLMNKYFLIIFTLFIIIHIILISGLRLYPFIDLPNHLSEATILRYYNEKGNEFSKYYSIRLFPKPNIFHMVFCSLPVFPSPETGNRIFYSLYVILLPLSLFLVIKKIGGNPWFAILSFLFLYNYNVSCGLTGFTMGIPLVLIIFYFSLDKKTCPGKKILTGILFLLLFTVHAINTVFALLLFFILKIYYNKNSPLNFIREFSPALTVILLIFIWWSGDSAGGESTMGFLLNYYKKEYFQTIIKRMGLFMYDNYFLYDGKTGVFIALFFSMAVIVPLFYGLIKYKKEIYLNTNYRPVLLFIILSLSCFLFLPDRIPENWRLYERFSVFVFLSLIILLSIIYSKKISHLFIVFICLIFLSHFTLWTGYFLDFQKENKNFSKSIFPDPEKGKILTGFIQDNSYRGKPVYIHFPNYYIIWSKGIASTMIIDYRFGPVRRKVGTDIIPSYLDMVLKRNTRDGALKNITTLLIRSNNANNMKIKDFKPLNIRGYWGVYMKEL